MRSNLIYILAILFFTAFISDDNTLLIKITTQYEKYLQENPQEKVYLHFDKPYYMAGDTIWFKGYLFDANSHSVDSVSKVLYVDLVDKNQGKTIKFQIHKCNSGYTNGDIIIPDTLKDGVYTVRAYTNYMKNFSDEWFFSQNLKIWKNGSRQNLGNATSSQNTEIADIQFFPEGGTWLDGTETRMAFKAVNSFGKGIDTEGFILDNKKDTVKYFKTEHLGMGFVNLTANTSNSYKAYIKKADGSYLTVSLPNASNNGHSLVVDNTTYADKIKVFVYNSIDKLSDDYNKEIVLVAQQRGKIGYVAKGNNTQKLLAINIPRNKFVGDGIVQITLFDNKGEPICERLVFVNQKKNQIQLKISSSKTVYATREKTQLELEAKDNLGNPVEGTFSISVTDALQVIPNKYQENLLSYLLLSSDIGSDAALHGIVENPAYYFSGEDYTIARHLDILMMTQGWRRFEWKNIINPTEKKQEFPIETGIHITGKALKPNKSVAKNVSLTLMLKSENGKSDILVSSTDSLGNYEFYDLDFTDSTKILIQGTKENGGKNLNMIIDNSIIERPKFQIVKIPFNIIEFERDELTNFIQKANEMVSIQKNLNNSLLLNEVVIKGKNADWFDNRRIYGRATNTVVIDNNLCNSYSNILLSLQGKVPGLTVFSTAGGNYGVSMRGTRSLSGGGEALYLLDGTTMSSADAISMISPCDVEKVEILKGADAAIFGGSAANGVVSILTKKGNKNYDYKNDPVHGILTQKRLGYHSVRKFYSPKYETQIDKDKTLNDYRSTIYWNPDVHTDANGKAIISYYNSDAQTNIHVVAEGISKLGHLGVTEYNYKVNNK